MSMFVDILRNYYILALVSSDNIWYESMQDANGLSNWVQSVSPPPTIFDFTTGVQTEGCPTTNFGVIRNDCWRVCAPYSSVSRSAATIGYKDISLTFDIDPWSMLNPNQHCDIEWSTDAINWNLLDSSTGAAHLTQSTVYLGNTSWHINTVHIRVYVNSAPPSNSASCCYISHFALNGTLMTPATTPYTSTTMYVSATSATTGTNFFIDKDWVLKKAYPWPVNQCIQTAPALTSVQFTYYQCSPNGQHVTKYKWSDGSKIYVNFDCANLSAADEITSYNKTESDTSCDLYYFECNGNDDYTTANFYLSLDTACSNPQPLFTISVASNVCYCESAAASLMLQCDATDATVYNYSGSSCDASLALPSQQSLGRAGTPTFFITYNVMFYICAEMAECIIDSVIATNSPTPPWPTHFSLNDTSMTPTTTPYTSATTTPYTSATTTPPPSILNLLQPTPSNQQSVDSMSSTLSQVLEPEEDDVGNGNYGIWDIKNIMDDGLIYVIIGAAVLLLICCGIMLIFCRRRKKIKQVHKFVHQSLTMKHVQKVTPCPPVAGLDLHLDANYNNDIEMMLHEGIGITVVGRNNVLAGNNVVAVSPSGGSNVNSNVSIYEQQKNHIKGQDTAGFHDNLSNIVGAIDLVMDDMINEIDGGHVTGGADNDYLSDAQREAIDETHYVRNGDGDGYELEQSVDGDVDSDARSDVGGFEGGVGLPGPPMGQNEDEVDDDDDLIMGGMTIGGQTIGGFDNYDDDEYVPPPPLPPVQYYED